MSRVKTFAVNRKARHDFQIEDTLEMGMELKGSEVKSIREGRINLRDSYARIRDGQVYLEGVHISPYSHSGSFNHEPLRARRLLAHRQEINRLAGKVAEKGYTLVPLSVYLNDRGKIKVEIGLARGKTHRDRRRELAERDMRREVERSIKARRTGEG